MWHLRKMTFLKSWLWISLNMYSNENDVSYSLKYLCFSPEVPNMWPPGRVCGWQCTHVHAHAQPHSCKHHRGHSLPMHVSPGSPTQMDSSLWGLRALVVWPVQVLMASLVWVFISVHRVCTHLPLPQNPPFFVPSPCSGPPTSPKQVGELCFSL